MLPCSLSKHPKLQQGAAENNGTSSVASSLELKASGEVSGRGKLDNPGTGILSKGLPNNPGHANQVFPKPSVKDQREWQTNPIVVAEARSGVGVGHDMIKSKDPLLKTTSARKQHKSATSSFPSALYCLLEDAEQNSELRKIITWLPDGLGFKIHDETDFCNIVMKKYFRTQTKFHLFTRQVSLFGSFCRVWYSLWPSDCLAYNQWRMTIDCGDSLQLCFAVISNGCRVLFSIAAFHLCACSSTKMKVICLWILEACHRPLRWCLSSC